MSAATRVRAGQSHVRAEAATTRRLEPPNRPQGRPDPLRTLQRSLGNRALGTLLRQAGLESQAQRAGRPLDPGTLRAAESRFGRTFGQVRIHDDPAAGELADRLDARAFTIGSEITFAPGEYAPGTPSGDRVLDHELAHVVQQQRGGHRPPSSEPGAATELAADNAAEAAGRGDGGIVPVSGATAPGLAMQQRAGSALRPEDMKLLQEWLSSAEASRSKTPQMGTLGGPRYGNLQLLGSTRSEPKEERKRDPWVPTELRDEIEQGKLEPGTYRRPYTWAEGYQSHLIVRVGTTGPGQAAEIYREYPEDLEFYLSRTRGDERAARVLQEKFVGRNRDMRRFVGIDDPYLEQGYQPIEFGWTVEQAEGEFDYVENKVFRTQMTAIGGIDDEGRQGILGSGAAISRLAAGLRQPQIGGQRLVPGQKLAQMRQAYGTQVEREVSAAVRRQGPTALPPSGAPSPLSGKLVPPAPAPPAPAPTGQVVVVGGGGGQGTTVGGLSAAGREQQVLLPASPGTAVAPSGALTRAGERVLQSSATTPTKDVAMPGAGATWTTDPSKVVAGLPPGKEVTAASLRGSSGMAAPVGPAPSVTANLGELGGQTARQLASQRARGAPPGLDQERRDLPGARRGDVPADLSLPGVRQEGSESPHFPWLDPQGSADPRWLPGERSDVEGEYVLPGQGQMSQAPDSLKQYVQYLSPRDRRLEDLRPLQRAEYREHTYKDRRDDALEGHEVAQNVWLQIHGYVSDRGTGKASRWNPTIALTPEAHRAVSAYQAALGLHDRAAMRKMGYPEMLDLNELALRQGLSDSGYADDVIDRVVNDVTQQAWEHTIFTIAKGKRRKTK